VIQLKSGRIVLPICYYLPRSWSQRGEGFNAFTYTGQFDTSAMYSDDDGQTWRKSPSDPRTPGAEPQRLRRRSSRSRSN
jgi:hypothetical protein